MPATSPRLFIVAFDESTINYGVSNSSQFVQVGHKIQGNTYAYSSAVKDVPEDMHEEMLGQNNRDWAKSLRDLSGYAILWETPGVQLSAWNPVLWEFYCGFIS